MKPWLPVLGSFLASVALASPSAAQTLSGDIDSRIELVAACLVNGSGSGTIDFGLLDFGEQPTFFGNAAATVNGGASGIQVQCSPGTDAILTFVSGLNDDQVSGSNRALRLGAQYVPYDIYTDAGFATVIANGATIPIPGTGDVETIPIYGRALGAAALQPGIYTDTISVTLEF